MVKISGIVSIIELLLVVLILIYLLFLMVQEQQSYPIITNASVSHNNTLQPSTYFADKSYFTEYHDLVNSSNNYLKIQIPENYSIVRVARTGSMHSAISDDSIVIEIIPRNESDIHVGDIIVFNCTEKYQYIIHRVIEITTNETGTYYLTKGDNNIQDDFKLFGCRATFDRVSQKIIGVLY